MMNQYMKEVLDDQDKGTATTMRECLQNYGQRALYDFMTLTNDSSQTPMCPAYFDGILCWPDAEPNTLLTRSCPPYVAGFLPFNNATRICTKEGVWFVNKHVSINSSWTNYTSCFENDTATILRDIHTSEVPKILEKYVPLVKVIAETGYIVSLSSLIIAFAIMLFIKKLHCSRNILHMHLFVSFMLRAFTSIVKNMAFVNGIGLPLDFLDQNGSLYFNVNSQTNNWGCKLLTSFWQYFITANYSWILMEGLYLHNLIFRALFADSNNSIRLYVILGWGLPLLIIGKWVIVRLLLEDTFCWSTTDNTKIFFIILIPTTISHLVNFVLFVKISVVLYRKLRSPVNDDSRKYQKWVRSTLVLVPLFGVHYALFLAFYFSKNTSKVVELVWLFCDQLFGSFQGFFVAVLYCFLNGEVKAEIRPHLENIFMFLATNRYLKHCFPCRQRFLRSVVGRNSVCTTMSCSSLYNNGVIHRSSKSRLDSNPKLKHSSQTIDRTRDLHSCHHYNGGAKSLQDMRRHSKPHNKRHSQPVNLLAGSTMTTETTLCQECRNEENEEMVRMVQNNV